MPTLTARTIEVPENRTTSPTTIINDDTKSRANLFEGTRKSVDIWKGYSSCPFARRRRGIFDSIYCK
jgi:hypothetical protein